MGKWKVIHKVYDNGTAETSMCEAEQDESNSYTETEHYDQYVDVFDDRLEAEKLLDELLSEGKPDAD